MTLPRNYPALYNVFINPSHSIGLFSIPPENIGKPEVF